MIDTSNIHGWLQGKISSAEGRQAAFITKGVNELGEGFLDSIKETYKEQGNKAAKEYGVPVTAAAGSYGGHREILPQYQLVILAPQVASNYEDMKVETDKLDIKLAKTEGAQYIKLTRDGQGALDFVKQQMEN